MVKLEIRLSKARAVRLEKHLAQEHPITKGKMRIRKWEDVKNVVVWFLKDLGIVLIVIELLEVYKMEGHKIDGDDLMVNAKKIHGDTLKHYGKLEHDRINKLTPLLKD